MALFRILPKVVAIALLTLGFSACEEYEETNCKYEVENKSSQIIFLRGNLLYDNSLYVEEYDEALKPDNRTFYFYSKNKSEIDLTANAPTFIDKGFLIMNSAGKIYNKDIRDIRNWHVEMSRTQKNYASHTYTLIVTDDDFK